MKLEINFWIFVYLISDLTNFERNITQHKTQCKEIPNIYDGHHCILVAVYLSSYRQQLLRVSPNSECKIITYKSKTIEFHYLKLSHSIHSLIRT